MNASPTAETVHDVNPLALHLYALSSANSERKEYSLTLHFETLTQAQEAHRYVCQLAHEHRTKTFVPCDKDAGCCLGKGHLGDCDDMPF